MTAFQPSVFLAATRRLRVTNKGRSAFPSTNNRLGQLQTPASISACLPEWVQSQPGSVSAK